MKDKASPLQGSGSVRLEVGRKLTTEDPFTGKAACLHLWLELVSLFLLPILGFSRVKDTLLGLGPSVSWSSLMAWLGNVHRGPQKRKHLLWTAVVT